MTYEFEKNLAEFIAENELFAAGQNILLAVSGGADSIALMHALTRLKIAGSLQNKLFVAHINHNLRGCPANEDEQFVSHQCRCLKLPFIRRDIDVTGFADKNKLSTETAARTLRIAALTEIAKSLDCSTVATAHHKNDNAETMIQRLIRGTAYRGLAGIWPKRTFSEGISFARPMLAVSRKEIVDYLNNRALTWQTDHTNTDVSIRRNFIRHMLLPSLQKDCKADMADELFALSQVCRKFYQKTSTHADTTWQRIVTEQLPNEKVTFNLSHFDSVTVPVKIELFRRALKNVGLGEADITQQHYETITKLTTPEPDTNKIILPKRFTVTRRKNSLVFTKPLPANPQPAIKPQTLQIPGPTKFADLTIEAKVMEAKDLDLKKFNSEKTDQEECIDFDKLTLPLKIRSRQPGDRFIPLGQTGKKKAGKFLTAAKVDEKTRQKIAILADADKIIWLYPLRIAESVKVTEQTKKILQLKIRI